MAGITAVGIIGAADEGAEFTEFQAQAAVPALRAGASRLAGCVEREEMLAKIFVQSVKNLANGEIFGSIDGGGKGFPEIPKHRLPIQLASRNIVQLAL